MSALMATNGGPPVPTHARIPVFANGYLYRISIRSSSARTSLLVSNSWNASSGFIWIFLLTDFNQSTVSGCRASIITSSEQASVHTSHPENCNRDGVEDDMFRSAVLICNGGTELKDFISKKEEWSSLVEVRDWTCRTRKIRRENVR